MYTFSFRETLANEWTPKAVCESCADWLKFEDLSNRDQQDSLSPLSLTRTYFRQDSQIFRKCSAIFATLFITRPKIRHPICKAVARNF